MKRLGSLFFAFADLILLVIWLVTYQAVQATYNEKNDEVLVSSVEEVCAGAECFDRQQSLSFSITHQHQH